MPIKFPKRKHIGCDPMCGDCQEWLERVINKTKPATREAFKAFVNVIEALIPKAASIEFQDFWHSYHILEESVGLHVAECLPESETVIVSVKQKTAQPQPDAMWLPFG